MANTEQIRVEVGFDGGQVMSAQISAQAADELERALAAGDDGTLALDTDDGRYLVALRRIVYVKRFARESRLGFGN
jgi:hypothetical protein